MTRDRPSLPAHASTPYEIWMSLTAAEMRAAWDCYNRHTERALGADRAMLEAMAEAGVWPKISLMDGAAEEYEEIMAADEVMGRIGL